MNAEQFLNEALGGNMNISTLKPLAWYEIMDAYARHKLAEVAHSTSDNPSSPKFPTLEEVKNEVNCLLNSENDYSVLAGVSECYRIIVGNFGLR